MAKKRDKHARKIGRWAFLVGVLLAVILPFVTESITENVVAFLIAVGFIVGLLCVGEKETQPFLMSGAVLIIASAFWQSSFNILQNMFDALLVIFVPATVVVAVRNVFSIATN